MKALKISSFILLFIVCKSNFAQFVKGTKSIGTSISGEYINTPNSKLINRDLFSINLNPSFGYMIKDNLMLLIGTNLGYSSSHLPDRVYTQQMNNTFSLIQTKTDEQNYGLNIGLKKYFMAPNSKFGLFVYGGINPSVLFHKLSSDIYINSDLGNNSYTTTNYSHSFQGGVAFTPGVVYSATPYLQLEATMGGFNYKMDYAEKSIGQHHANLNFNTFSLGIRYSFLKK